MPELITAITDMISFGPVPSRRLGKSLGINNIVSPKVCSYNCIYCQVGKTIRKSCSRKLFFEPALIYENTARHLESLSQENYPDYLTFVSNGEPVLDINLGRSIMLLKKLGIPVAVITNASLLSSGKVRDDLSKADWVSLKTDAADNKVWQRINRPSRKLDFTTHIESIFQFASDYKGRLHTETMLVRGVNDSAENISGLAAVIKNISPLTAYLAIPIRPPAVSGVKVPDIDRLNFAWQHFTQQNLKAEFLTGFEGTETGYTGNIYEDILNITAVHPLREDSLMRLLEKDKAGYHVVESLINQKLIKSVLYEGKRFFIREYHYEN